MAAIRGGYKFRLGRIGEMMKMGLTLGLGIHLALGKRVLALDYAYADFGRLQQAHRVSLGLQFLKATNMTDKPNIVYLLADQIRACSLPVYGDTQIETPHIDRLAQEGTVFQMQSLPAPVCTPYRSMLLTGRHPQTTGHLINFVKTRHDEIGLGDVFSRNGYRTAWVGKWHLHNRFIPRNRRTRLRP